MRIYNSVNRVLRENGNAVTVTIRIKQATAELAEIASLGPVSSEDSEEIR